MPTRKTAAKKKTAPAEGTQPTPVADAPVPGAPAAGATGATLVCPRCLTAKFGPEERTRIDGKRTVRYTILVCERGHTFAKPVAR